MYIFITICGTIHYTCPNSNVQYQLSERNYVLPEDQTSNPLITNLMLSLFGQSGLQPDGCLGETRLAPTSKALSYSDIQALQV